jgi:hypothetical protein
VTGSRTRINGLPIPLTVPFPALGTPLQAVPVRIGSPGRLRDRLSGRRPGTTRPGPSRHVGTPSRYLSSLGRPRNGLRSRSRADGVPAVHPEGRASRTACWRAAGPSNSVRAHQVQPCDSASRCEGEFSAQRIHRRSAPSATARDARAPTRSRVAAPPRYAGCTASRHASSHRPPGSPAPGPGSASRSPATPTTVPCSSATRQASSRFSRNQAVVAQEAG